MSISANASDMEKRQREKSSINDIEKVYFNKKCERNVCLLHSTKQSGTNDLVFYQFFVIINSDFNRRLFVLVIMSILY